MQVDPKYIRFLERRKAKVLGKIEQAKVELNNLESELKLLDASLELELMDMTFPSNFLEENE